MLRSLAPTHQLKINTNLIHTGTMTPSTTGKSLPELVQALPQELYDEIYDLTFTADDNATVELRRDSKPFPSLLHVDRSSRDIFAKSYYANTTFTLAHSYFGRPGPAEDLDFFNEWLGLTAEHICLVENIIVKLEMRVYDIRNRAAYISAQKEAAFDTMEFLNHFLRCEWVLAPTQALRIQTWPGWREGFTSESMLAFERRIQATPAAAVVSPFAMNLRGTLDGESV